VDRSPPAGSSTSRPRRSRGSSRSAEASSTSASPGEPPLGPGAIRSLATAHGIRPSRSLGQHFLTDPNLAAAIVADASVGTDDRVLEIGAGLGSLTVALARTAAEVLAIEFDRALVPALREVVADLPNVRVLRADATKLEWGRVLGDDPWVLCANLPYNVATPIVLDALESEAPIGRLTVMVQLEVGERFVARPGDPGYGVASLRVANHATGRIVRRVPASVFWPRPRIDSVVVRLDRRSSPLGGQGFRRLVEGAFAGRRKTMRNALRRLGVEPGIGERLLAAEGISVVARPEELGPEAFASLAERLPA
jgi:16S rRNA (adenine1518-N6/adenine1519-N6)-dimethyltransferase